MTSVPRVAGVILAAGEARRMGRCKLLLPFQSSTILGLVADAAHRSSLEPLVLVLGANAGEIRAHLNPDTLEVVVNPDFRQGQSTSLKAGLAKVPHTCQGAMFLLGDQPRITPGIIDTLLRRFDPARDRLVIPVHDRRRGNPVIVHRALFPHIQELEGDQGARALFAGFDPWIRWVELESDDAFMDVDTPADYAKLLASGTPDEA